MATFPSNVGGEIPLEEADERIAAFRKTFRNVPDAFRISASLIAKALGSADGLTGLRFCLGQNSNGGFAPVIGGSTLEGEILTAFNTSGPIDLGEYNACSERWEGDKPYDLNWMFLGSDILDQVCRDFPDSSVNVCSDLNGKELSMCLLIQNPQGMKDDDGTECALNKGMQCPPTCN